jgi:hypothetical protein
MKGGKHAISDKLWGGGILLWGQNWMGKRRLLNVGDIKRGGGGGHFDGHFGKDGGICFHGIFGQQSAGGHIDFQLGEM